VLIDEIICRVIGRTPPWINFPQAAGLSRCASWQAAWQFGAIGKSGAGSLIGPVLHSEIERVLTDARTTLALCRDHLSEVAE